VSALVDEPALAHWFAAVLSTVLFPFFAVALGLSNGLLGIAARHPLGLAATMAYLSSLALSAWATWVRPHVVATRVIDVPIEGLARDLDGYRILHATDLHIGAFDTKAQGLRWAARANALAPDLVAVTGDLVTAGTVYYPDVAEVLGAFRAKDGVVVSLGNHDQWNPDELTRLIEEKGPRVLRNASLSLARGEGTLVVAGLDDWSTGKDDLGRALEGRRPGAPTVLLSHYPEFFAEAARGGVELVLSGHTHGGQIGVPFLSRRWSLSRVARQPAAGLHVKDKSRLYLNAGLGTTGPPLRLGIPPELAVLVLRAA
jgi:predicted MPP superfamily phosphohydrolase